jgi:hypothetical protein
MNTWDFVVSELKSLQQEFNDHQAIVELFVEQNLLYGYNIIKSKDQVYRLQNAKMLEV